MDKQSFGAFKFGLFSFYCILWADNLFLVSASGPTGRLRGAEVTKTRGEHDRNGKIERDLVGAGTSASNFILVLH